MSYRPPLRIEVDALGARWVFSAADKAMGDILRVEQEYGDITIEIGGDTQIRPEVVEPLCRVFVEGCRAWEGVEDEDGKPIPCTDETRNAIPTADKLVIMAAYLNKLQELAEKRGPGREQHTAPSPSHEEAEA